MSALEVSAVAVVELRQPRVSDLVMSDTPSIRQSASQAIDQHFDGILCVADIRNLGLSFAVLPLLYFTVLVHAHDPAMALAVRAQFTDSQRIVCSRAYSSGLRGRESEPSLVDLAKRHAFESLFEVCLVSNRPSSCFPSPHSSTVCVTPPGQRPQRTYSLVCSEAYPRRHGKPHFLPSPRKIQIRV